MQQHHYSAADLTGDPSFPSHLTPRQALALLNSHDVTRATLHADGAIVAAVGGTMLNDGIACPASFLQVFLPVAGGMFRAARILIWLGY